MILSLLSGLEEEEGTKIFLESYGMLNKLLKIMGDEIFFKSLWDNILISTHCRVSGYKFISHHLQKSKIVLYQPLVIESICSSLRDVTDVMSQRYVLDILCNHFKLEKTTFDDYKDLVNIVYTMTLILESCDNSVSRRVYQWLFDNNVQYFKQYSLKPFIDSMIIHFTNTEVSKSLKFNSIQILILFLERLDDLSESVVRIILPYILIYLDQNRKLLDDFFILLKKINAMEMWNCLFQFSKEKKYDLVFHWLTILNENDLIGKENLLMKILTELLNTLEKDNILKIIQLSYFILDKIVDTLSNEKIQKIFETTQKYFFEFSKSLKRENLNEYEQLYAFTLFILSHIKKEEKQSEVPIFLKGLFETCKVSENEN
jgi:hypothetical protein